ncbi:MAG: bifunctional DNA-formamidopyrimidine glycosylase/DNA-(apurinic or apyrimidinic site) lyase [Acidimicrobiales bacterium]
MPELPEVETVRRDLADVLGGARVVAVSVTGLRSTRRHVEPHVFVAGLVGARLVAFRRLGKYLLIDLDRGRRPDPEAVLVAHLRMSGQLRLASGPDEALARHTHVVVSFADGRQLRFVDPRTFGELFVTTIDVPELSSLGIDALDPALTVARLAQLLGARKGRMKAVLLDQRIVAGIGNIYSDEILWAARLRWSRRADSLRPVEIRRLHEAMVTTLGAAVEQRGSSLRDQQYVDLAGRSGTFQQRHAVYAHEGMPCRRCGRLIERLAVGGRSHFWCRRCQR